MRRQLTALLLALCLAAGLMPGALALSYPERPAGQVGDFANVLSEQTVTDAQTLSERLESAADMRLFVVTRHFLGGADIRAYADGLFEAWALGERDALLLLVVGEESYCLSVGAQVARVFPRETQNTLLSQYLQADYLNERYDAAVGGALTAMAALLAKQEGTAVSSAGLFGAPAATATPIPSLEAGDTESIIDWLDGSGWDGRSSWTGRWAGGTLTVETEDGEHEWVQEAQEHSGFSFWRVVLILFILSCIFGDKGKKRGCGCNPLGWILGALGISALRGGKKRPGHPYGPGPRGPRPPRR